MQSGETQAQRKALRRSVWRISDLGREFELIRTTVYKQLPSRDPRSFGPRPQQAALNEVQLVHVEGRLGVCLAIGGTHLHAELRDGWTIQ